MESLITISGFITYLVSQMPHFYNRYEVFIKIIHEIIFFVGAFGILKIFTFLRDRDFLLKTEEIEKNLKFRERVEKNLEEYVLESNKNGIKDIGIRFIYWKNYPNKISDDGFKHNLRINYDNGFISNSSWINSTGIFFQEHIWFLSQSIYLDKDGIFFIENENQHYKGFREFKNKCLVTHLPFTNIVNFDFKEYLEYEPIFYTKYPHNNLELYNTALYLRERLNDPYFSKELTKGKFLKKYSKINHVILRIKLLSLENFFKTKSINNGHNN